MQRKNSPFHRKSLLMLYAALEHRTDDVKNQFKSNGTLMAMISGRLTKKTPSS